MKSGSGMRWLVAGLVLVILLGGAGVGYWLVLSPQAQAEAAAARYSRPGPVYELGVIVTNLNDTSRPVYIQVGLELEMDGKHSLKEIQRRDGAVRDSVIRILRSKEPEDVQGDSGMGAVASEIRFALNSLLTQGSVKEVYFTQFMVQ